MDAVEFVEQPASAPADEAQLANLQQLLGDCEVAFTARSTGGKDYSAGDTFWLASNVAPRSGLEQLAREVFEFHTANVEWFDAESSGAEWWTLVLDSESDSVGMHWDKDYTVEADCGVNVFPILSTVTYLSERGAPTLVIEKTAPVMYDESFAGKATVAHLSRPFVCKHISFDGRYLHGASNDLTTLWSQAPTSAPSANASSRRRAAATSTSTKSKSKSKSKALQSRSEASTTAAATPVVPPLQSAWSRVAHRLSPKRVTFLVNVWLNHRPVSAVVFPDELLGKLKLSRSRVRLRMNQRSMPRSERSKGSSGSKQPQPHNVGESTPAILSIRGGTRAADDVRTLTWSFKQTKRHQVSVPLPLETLSQHGATHDSFTFHYKRGAKIDVQ